MQNLSTVSKSKYRGAYLLLGFFAAAYPDGSVRIFYGVTPDGLGGPWEEVVRLTEEAGYQGPEPAE